jgi:hypothetical protein
LRDIAHVLIAVLGNILLKEKTSVKIALMEHRQRVKLGKLSALYVLKENTLSEDFKIALAALEANLRMQVHLFV